LKLVWPPQFEIPQGLEIYVHEYGTPNRSWAGLRSFCKALNFTGSIKLIHFDGTYSIYKYKDGNPRGHVKRER
jgi:hypothetical protein